MHMSRISCASFVLAQKFVVLSRVNVEIDPLTKVRDGWKMSRDNAMLNFKLCDP